MRLIQVPYHAGDERAASSAGAKRIVEAGAAEVLGRHGVSVEAQTISRAGPFRDTASSSADVNRLLAAAVREAASANELPLVLTGSCDSAIGVVSGLDDARCGVVWLDAHGDFNTPESTASGFFPGMALAVVVGHCYGAYRAALGDAAPVAEDAVALFGVRDLSPDEERARLEGSGIHLVAWEKGEAQGDVDATLDDLRRRVTDVYLHVDFDAFAPEVAPGVADESVPGGLSREDAETIVRATTERFRVRAATLATYAPERDRDDATLGLALSLLDLLGEHAAGAGAD